MTSTYIDRDDAKAREIMSRVLGDVPCFSGEFAIDQDLDAVVVSLGGRPARDPATDDGRRGTTTCCGAPMYSLP